MVESNSILYAKGEKPDHTVTELSQYTCSNSRVGSICISDSDWS